MHFDVTGIDFEMVLNVSEQIFSSFQALHAHPEQQLFRWSFNFRQNSVASMHRRRRKPRNVSLGQQGPTVPSDANELELRGSNRRYGPDNNMFVSFYDKTPWD